MDGLKEVLRGAWEGLSEALLALAPLIGFLAMVLVMVLLHEYCPPLFNR